MKAWWTLLSEKTGEQLVSNLFSFGIYTNAAFRDNSDLWVAQKMHFYISNLFQFQQHHVWTLFWQKCVTFFFYQWFSWTWWHWIRRTVAAVIRCVFCLGLCWLQSSVMNAALTHSSKSLCSHSSAAFRCPWERFPLLHWSFWRLRGVHVADMRMFGRLQECFWCPSTSERRRTAWWSSLEKDLTSSLRDTSTSTRQVNVHACAPPPFLGRGICVGGGRTNRRCPLVSSPSGSICRSSS